MQVSNLKIVAAHLDLKGVRFKESYDEEYLDNLRSLGFNSLVIEYEDAFPFKDILISNDRKTTWSVSRVQRFLQKAAGNNLEIIPLQQTFGHLEYVFRWAQYSHYALPGHPSTIDLFNSAGVALVDEMLRQILIAHERSRFVQVGMDETHSLIETARLRKRPPLHFFLKRLEEVCNICESHGKTPILFSDMLEEYADSESLSDLAKFRKRIVLQPWNYSASQSRSFFCRFGGIRVARHWLQNPTRSGPSPSESVGAVEALNDDLFRLVKPHYDGRTFASLHIVDIWIKLGFRVFGTTAVRVSSDGQCLIPSGKRSDNIATWTEKLALKGVIGLLASSWARGNSFCPPNALPDATWCLLQRFSASCGANPEPFFGPHIQGKIDFVLDEIDRLLAGEVRGEKLVEEMMNLVPKIRNHKNEWMFLCLLAETVVLQKTARLIVLEVQEYLYSDQISPVEWERRINDQVKFLSASVALEKRVRIHVQKKYEGKFLREWVQGVFRTSRFQISVLKKVSRGKLRRSKILFSQTNRSL